MKPPAHNDRFLHYLLTVAPFLALASYIYRLHIDVPYMDDWDFVDLLDKYYSGTLRVSDIFIPHNQHIIAIPQLIMLFIAITSNWNTSLEVFISVTSSVLTYFILCASIPKSYPTNIKRHLQIALSVLTFSMAQGYNWVWGWQMQIPLFLAFSLLGLKILFHNNDLSNSIVAAFCGLISCLCFGTGWLFWPIAFFFVAKSKNYPTQQKILWGLLLLSSITIFKILQNLDPHKSNIGNALAAIPPLAICKILIVWIIKSLIFGIACLGAIVTQENSYAALTAGAAGMLIFLFLSCHDAKVSTILTSSQNLLTVFGVFGIACSILVGLGRSYMGLDEAVTDRYTTLTIPFWAALLIKLLSAADSKKINISSFKIFIFGFIVLLITLNSINGVNLMKWAHHRLNIAAIDIQEEISNPEFNPNTSTDSHRLDVLRSHQLSIFRLQNSHEN